MPDPDLVPPLQLFSSVGTVTAVSSPVRNNILLLIRDEGEVSFSRIMEYTIREKETSPSSRIRNRILFRTGLLTAVTVPSLENNFKGGTRSGSGMICSRVFASIFSKRLDWILICGEQIRMFAMVQKSLTESLKKRLVEGMNC